MILHHRLVLSIAVIYRQIRVLATWAILACVALALLYFDFLEVVAHYCVSVLWAVPDVLHYYRGVAPSPDINNEIGIQAAFGDHHEAMSAVVLDILDAAHY